MSLQSLVLLPITLLLSVVLIATGETYLTPHNAIIFAWVIGTISATIIIHCAEHDARLRTERRNNDNRTGGPRS
jgi:hypothetical protein